MPKPKRLIASIQKDPKLPSIIFFCCMHGNEKAGFLALQSFFEHISAHQEHIQGNLYAVFGNQEAFLKEQRYIHKDLNRIWTKSHLEEASRNTEISEYNELIELYNVLYELLNFAKAPVYAIDLHTTSGPTQPFIVMNDALNNRAFVRNLGYPVIFNIESFIEGALLNLLSDHGHVSLAFEGGEHYAENSVDEIIAFCYKTLFHAGLVSAANMLKMKIPETHFKAKKANYFEMIYRHALHPNDRFQMRGNYVNFQQLKKGEPIAWLNDELIHAPKSVQIFMPLYQSKGEDGFFYVQHMSRCKLKVARVLRRLSAERILTIFPGIKKINSFTMCVPKPLEKLIPKRIWFALGYRKSVELENQQMYYTKQDRELSNLPELKKYKSPYQELTNLS